MEIEKRLSREALVKKDGKPRCPECREPLSYVKSIQESFINYKCMRCSPGFDIYVHYTSVPPFYLEKLYRVLRAKKNCRSNSEKFKKQSQQLEKLIKNKKKKS